MTNLYIVLKKLFLINLEENPTPFVNFFYLRKRKRKVIKRKSYQTKRDKKTFSNPYKLSMFFWVMLIWNSLVYITWYTWKGSFIQIYYQSTWRIEVKKLSIHVKTLYWFSKPKILFFFKSLKNKFKMQNPFQIWTRSTENIYQIQVKKMHFKTILC